VGVALIAGLLFKMALFISHSIKGGRATQRWALPLPWEANDANHSLKILSQLSAEFGETHLTEGTVGEEVHYPSPLRSEHSKVLQKKVIETYSHLPSCA